MVVITLNKEKKKLYIDKIPYDIVNIATHTESGEDYLIIKSILLFRIIPMKIIKSLDSDFNLKEVAFKARFHSKNICKHYKNKQFYRILAEAITYDSLDEYILYESLYDNHRLWLRPKDMFYSKVNYNGEYLDRFHAIKDYSTLQNIEKSLFL
ncbi:DUF1653 domain-containing protein [Alkaliphilus sp. B6464]|uniref:DUF1653 domain-containing protein n=1 Tax=Alkaliphilus sp. B6464 TaxID=2731219 RepID=UPI001BA79028|nr:DUF1653 domain-containing protein [Alkaliphilus sp. B6464]QUH21782.1 DUF1653 domain-containing protein [Alkaliphilus sp. B6464]